MSPSRRSAVRNGEPTASYDVTVKGDVGPAVSAQLRRQCAVEVSHSARLVVHCTSSYDLTTLHELLEKRGLTVVSIRPLPNRSEPPS